MPSKCPTRLVSRPRWLQSRIPTLGIRCGEAISSSRMSPKMAQEADESDEEEADGEDVESRMQRVRTERRELHSAVG